MDDVRRATSMDLAAAGNRVYLVGITSEELGGSHFFLREGLEGGRVPRPDLATAPALLRALAGAIGAGLVESCHDLSEGGLAVAAAEMAFAGDLGLRLDLGAVLGPDPAAGSDLDATRLFSESCTRFLVEVSPENADAFAARLAGHPATPIGEVCAEPVLECSGTDGSPVIKLPIDDLRRAFLGGFRG
jgi:phosphoribosylformylglycinamidine synthase